MIRRYFAAFDDQEAYAVSHVGFGLNAAARYEALACYDQRETNGTELRAYAGNFLFSTGANEFAGRFTKGHFDLPVRGCTISLDGSRRGGRRRGRLECAVDLCRDETFERCIRQIPPIFEPVSAGLDDRQAAHRRQRP